MALAKEKDMTMDNIESEYFCIYFSSTHQTKALAPRTLDVNKAMCFMTLVCLQKYIVLFIDNMTV